MASTILGADALHVGIELRPELVSRHSAHFLLPNKRVAACLTCAASKEANVFSNTHTQTPQVAHARERCAAVLGDAHAIVFEVGSLFELDADVSPLRFDRIYCGGGVRRGPSRRRSRARRAFVCVFGLFPRVLLFGRVSSWRGCRSLETSPQGRAGLCSGS